MRYQGDNMKVLLTTFNSTYIHKNLALRWIYVARPEGVYAEIKEYTINDDVSDAFNYIKEHGFNVVGLSTYIWNVDQMKALIQMIKDYDSKIKVVLGGPEVTYENDEWFDYPIDGIILGEGERIFWDFIIDGKDEAVKLSKDDIKFPYKEDIAYLETLESPYNLEIDHADMDKKYLYVETSRGCPFRCSYCLSSLDNKVRYFSMDYLQDVFDSVKDYEIEQVKFLDRTFNSNKKRTHQLYSMLDQYQNIESFQVEIVADRLSDDLINMIIDEKNADRFRYEVGIQSFNQKTLHAIDRIQDNKRAKQVIACLGDHDVVVHADLIAGLPYEDFESFRDSFNQLAIIYPSELQLGILKLLKGTKMKKQALEMGYKYNHEAPYEVYETPWLTREEMEFINVVASGVDRSINRGQFMQTVKYISEDVYDFDLFEMFHDFGVIINSFELRYQKYDLYRAIYEFYKSKVSELEVFKTYLNIDYYTDEKQKPKLLFQDLPLKALKQLNRRVIDHDYFSEEIVYRYSRIFKDARSDDAYVFVKFNADQQPCALYQIDFKEDLCQKILY